MPRIKNRPSNRRPRTARAVSTPASRRRPMTAEDLLKFHLVSDPQISPDGRNVLLVKKHVGSKNESVINIWKVEVPRAGRGPRPQPTQFSSGNMDRHPRWSPDGKRVAFISARDKHRPQIYMLSSSGGEAVALTGFPEGTIGSFKWSPDGKGMAVTFRETDSQLTEKAKKEREEKGLSTPPRVIDDWWYRLDGDGYFLAQRYRLYLVNAATGKHKLIYGRDTLGGFDFDFSPDSKQLVIATNRDPKALAKPWKTELLRLNVSTGAVKPIPNLSDGPKSCVRWSPDGKSIAYGGRIGQDDTYSTDNLEVFICDPVKGQPRSLTKNTDYCLMSVAITDTAEVAFAPKLMWSADSRRVYFRLGWHGEQHLASVPARGGRIVKHTRGTIDCDPGGMSADGKYAALAISKSHQLGEIHVARLGPGGSSTVQVTDFNGPLLREIALAPVESQWVPSSDGTKVQVWSIKPAKHKRGRRVPAILEVHGGPHAMYGVGFFHEFQVLTAAGYAVFFSNPRGSKGYGRDFCRAIRGNWGGPDWEDVQAATKFIKKQSYVDPRRVGIMGGSYGGYMTNWAIGHSNDYKAAITDRCVSNLVSMFGSSDYPGDPDRYWPGNSWDDTEVRWHQSPLKYFGNVKTPTLVIHSEGDLRCNVEQAEQVFTALKLRNVPTRFVRYPSSTFHGMSRNGPPDLRIHRLHQILDWWKRWLR